MEIGVWTVYFVQYKSKAGHWVTKSVAYGSYLKADAARLEHERDYSSETRIVRQTTENVLA
jgi:hypothetical protein